MAVVPHDWLRTRWSLVGVVVVTFVVVTFVVVVFGVGSYSAVVDDFT